MFGFDLPLGKQKEKISGFELTPSSILNNGDTILFVGSERLRTGNSKQGPKDECLYPGSDNLIPHVNPSKEGIDVVSYYNLGL